MNETILAVTNLHKSYHGVEVVKGVSLDVMAGEVYGILGPNGAGKTTTMEMIEGLRHPDAGEIYICGLNAATAMQQIRELIGVQLQTSQMLANVTVHELVDLYGRFYAKRQPVAVVLAELDLTSKADAFVQSLSGGQRQRVAIALAVVHQPRVVFLDEPTTGLDPNARRALWSAIRRLRSEGTTVIMSTHYMEEAEVLCDRVAIFDQGQIVVHGSPKELIGELNFRAVINMRTPLFSEDRTGTDVLSGIRSLPGVVRLEEEGDEIALYTMTPAETLVQTVRHLEQHGLGAPELRTRSANLEDVFLTLTGKWGEGMC